MIKRALFVYPGTKRADRLSYGDFDMIGLDIVVLPNVENEV